MTYNEKKLKNLILECRDRAIKLAEESEWYEEPSNVAKFDNLWQQLEQLSLLV